MAIDFVKVKNELQKPGPVFNRIAQVAYEKGADYFYRVNDDTEFLQPWTSTFIDTLEVRKIFEDSGFSGLFIPSSVMFFFLLPISISENGASVRCRGAPLQAREHRHFDA